ncbi:pyridoxamine 5'-phosphate oxidase family protein [Limobrevibacterium gyesilva]|uniref:Pyridoxamine 5'-phosphate oxidase family protein n=1 Tax=Limobrevibacterium gyesilva TaxID=2991712 RepID=A0AA41YQR0_9PROT|nr:pyridoxamine 5'-phosphate oxidase family protein [Limobrevibacterium gyesilva]MCW3474893.1 pyridoxamine 5'-phosphate oxidase family protein [Limobrevibacterium gyesilva]
MSTENPRNLIWKHIHGIGTCMMVTHDGEHVRARPMTGIVRPEQNVIWFFTDTQTSKDEELQRDPRASLTFADLRDQNFVSVSGRITRVLDKETISDLWDEGAEAYFPNGPDDPGVVLLKFVPEFGEYWDAPSSTIVMAIKFIEAHIMGERPDLGTSGAAKFS